MKQISQGCLKEVQLGYINLAKTYNIIINCSKPFIAIIDGLTFGGAANYAMSPRYRVVTERAVFAMPETAIGYFPDSGASFFLSRLTDNFGLYMGLTGARLRGFDIKKVGLATHYIESSKLVELEADLINLKTHEEVSEVLDKYSSYPTPYSTDLDLVIPSIKKCFDGSSIEEIFKNLRNDNSDWAMNIIKSLNQMSPTSLKVTHRSITSGKNMTIQDCLKMESRLGTQHNVQSDLKEGIRALLVDKDYKPKWSPRAVQEVTDDQVARFFTPSSYDCVIDFESNSHSKL